MHMCSGLNGKEDRKATTPHLLGPWLGPAWWTVGLPEGASLYLAAQNRPGGEKRNGNARVWAAKSSWVDPACWVAWLTAAQGSTFASCQKSPVAIVDSCTLFPTPFLAACLLCRDRLSYYRHMLRGLGAEGGSNMSSGSAVSLGSKGRNTVTKTSSLSLAWLSSAWPCPGWLDDKPVLKEFYSSYITPST